LKEKGKIYGFNGVYANVGKLETNRDLLKEVLEGWILLRVSLHFPLSTIANQALEAS
jgi:hypothetical protein